MISLATETERTLFLIFCLLTWGSMRLQDPHSLVHGSRPVFYVPAATDSARHHRFVAILKKNVWTPTLKPDNLMANLGNRDFNKIPTCCNSTNAIARTCFPWTPHLRRKTSRSLKPSPSRVRECSRL